MSEIGTGGRGRPASNNVYTVLALVAVLVLLSCVGYVWYRSSQLFKSGSPFTIETTGSVR
ncbi:MAG: hypothetical protein K8S99_17585 [Planctomycetes bacterium]|nr:hypothetical protein [Planctomycetota bacterium]